MKIQTMKQQRLLHAGFWLLMVVIITEPIIRARDTQGMMEWLIYFALYLSSFYANYSWLFPRWQRDRQWAPLLLGWLGLMLLDTVVVLGLNAFFGRYQEGTIDFKILRWFLHTGYLFCYLMPLGIAWRFAEDWFYHDRIKRRMETQQLTTELAFLKSQLNPHFLFNTLNSIYVLAYQQSPDTADAVMKLSEMMHYMMDDSNQDRVPLRKELAYIEQLIALQRLRVHGEMACHLTVNGDLDQYRIAPLLLVPFVENIFKHAVLNDAAHPVEISLVLCNDQLCFQAANLINEGQKDPGKGIGLVNVQRRLELLYPGKYRYETSISGRQYTIALTIQLS
ncbi:sensor histidine kinase [Chitinophaga qingshengii]|uniref:Sensor histidine kinase n=1 Tax=Chitinophaga qingshengii TaxID=1569794 RepID=A0ABR7THH0_9BACT|nr:sensor histidine kinase [Chitinophaga qingshengii]MBC9929050.1 sensor histidine kinase [Chitinophaga qingshengii]